MHGLSLHFINLNNIIESTKERIKVIIHAET